MHPPDIDAHLRSAAAAQKSGRVADAIPHYRAALRLKPNPRVPLVLGMLIAQTRRFDEALPLLEQACLAHPQRPDAWMALAPSSAAPAAPAKPRTLRSCSISNAWSYLYHRTLPFRSAEPRISMAFDVLPTG